VGFRDFHALGAFPVMPPQPRQLVGHDDARLAALHCGDQAGVAGPVNAGGRGQVIVGVDVIFGHGPAARGAELQGAVCAGDLSGEPEFLAGESIDIRPYTSAAGASATGATTRELMHRMGHGSMRAALIYQHATNARDRSIADALSALVESGRTEALESSDDSEDQTDEDGGDGDGEAGALVPVV
jgi:hypothetical protein